MLYSPMPRPSRDILTNAHMAELTRGLNRPDEIRRRFIDIQPLFRRDLPGIGMVQVMVPTSQYGYGGVMVVAARETLSVIDDEGGQGSVVATDANVDLDPALQYEYYRQTLASIQAEEDLSLPRADEMARVVAFENTSASISTERHRLPRTIALPHMQVIRDGSWITEASNLTRPHGFRLEQTLLQDQDLFTRFNDRWKASLPEAVRLEAGGTVDLYQRGSPPYGYTIDGHINRSDPLDEQARRATHLLQASHDIYSGFVRDEALATDESRRIHRGARSANDEQEQYSSRPLSNVMMLQPSYRTYIYYHDDELRITICPMFLASVGALEAMNTAVDRSPNNSLLYTDEEIADFLMRFTVRLQTLISG